MKKLILKPPVLADITRLLTAWRVWLGGALAGAILAGLVYLTFPPAYRAQATVLVDQNVEQVIPEEQTDLLKYTYLQREADRLVGLAWSDATLANVSSQTGLPVAELRDGRLLLSQPQDGNWHFLADSRSSEEATRLASAWARAFTEEVQSQPPAISPLTEVNLAQDRDLPVFRVASLGLYIFSGSLIGVVLLALILLFIGGRDS